MMSNEELTGFIQGIVPDAEFEESPQYLVASVSTASCRKLMEELRNNEKTAFDYLYCLSGVDRPEHLEVVYHLTSTSLGHNVTIKARTADREDPKLPTVCDIWRTAEFHEREVYDLYGIVFENHPDLRRIFLDDDWVGWPMRKDYEDPINMIDY